MAYSSSIKRAQAIKLCELCQEEPIKWVCIDCDMGLCVKCKTSHLKIPVTAQHQIIKIGTPLQNVPKKIVINNIQCKDHPNKMAGFFCKSCDSLICPTCVSSTHKKHDFVPIESALEEKLDYLRGIHDKIDDNLKSCDSKTSELQDIKPRYNAIFDDSLTKINKKEQELIDSIRKYSKDLQEKVENERSQVNKILTRIEQDVKTKKKNIEDQKSEIDATLNSSQGSVIFKATMMIKDLMFDSLPNQVEQFNPATESTKKTEELFGSLQKIPIPTTPTLPEMDFEVITSSITDLPFISSLVTLDKISAWINCYNKTLIRKINIQDNKMATSQEVALRVYDMAVNSKNELLLSMEEGSDVKLLKKTGEVVSFMTVSPLLPFGIHVTKDDDVIIGFTEPGDTFTPADQSERAIIIFGMDGKQKHKYQYDKDVQRLFTVPERITTNNNQDILVVDRTSENTGRVVVLNKDRNLKWLYDGHHKINASDKFDVRDIATTSVGHVIVSDMSSHALHVLSENGEVLICKVLRDMGVTCPWGLDIDNGGRLWLGCGTGGKQTGAIIHIIKLV